MAKNFLQPGKILTIAAPYDRLSGQGALIGAIFGVALGDVLNAAAGDFSVEGVWSLAKTSAQAWVLGDRIYWDNANKRCDNDPTKGPLIGVAVAAAANPTSVGSVRLNEGVPGLDEAAQGAQIADLTDNSGGAAADGTIGAVTAPAAITDNSGGVDPGNNTIAAVTNPDLSAWNGATDPSAAQATAIGAAFTAVKAAAAQLAAKQNVDRTAVIAITDAVKELSTKVNAMLAALRTAGIIKT